MVLGAAFHQSAKGSVVSLHPRPLLLLLLLGVPYYYYWCNWVTGSSGVTHTEYKLTHGRLASTTNVQ